MTKVLATTRTTERGRPAQYKQSSRKGKNAWRKNIDLTATEAALEDVREQERASGTPAHAQQNGQLFVEDRSGQETQIARQAREKRKLKSQEILAARSAVPAVGHRARSTFQLDTQSPAGKANAAGLPAKLKRRLRLLAQRPHEGIQGVDEVGSAGKLQSEAVLAEKHDLWNAPAKPTAAPSGWLSSTAQVAIHDPLAAAKSAAAIPPPHAGSSYNPDYDDHEALLQNAFEKASALEEDSQKSQALRKQWRGVTAEQPARPDEHRGMPIDEPLDDLSEEEAEADTVAKQPKRKTLAQRRREARAKEQFDQAEERRKQRRTRAMLSEMPGQIKKLKQQALRREDLVKERRARKQERLQREGIAGYKLGKHAVPEKRIDVQTGDELSESLRQLKPEGNLFWDRFQNLQARGLAEPRRPVLPTHRIKTKYYDRHTFKRD